MVQVLCKVCGRAFSAIRRENLYCSSECRRDAYADSVGLTVGVTFGKLRIIGPGRKEGPQWLVKVQCECGVIKDVYKNTLKKKAVIKSCGCEQRVTLAKLMRKHGHAVHTSTSREYSSWKSMKARCDSSKSPEYRNYGGRGIIICERWRHFANFLADMGPRPEATSLDRIDVNGNYEPTNCRWATATEQAQNTRRSHIIEYNGVRQCLTQWALQYHVHPVVLYSRLKRGMSMEQALSTPSKSIQRRKRNAKAL